MLENKRDVIALLLRCPNCGERGSIREKGIDGRHAEVDSLGLGNQPGTTSIRERKRVFSLPASPGEMILLAEASSASASSTRPGAACGSIWLTSVSVRDPPYHSFPHRQPAR